MHILMEYETFNSNIARSLILFPRVSENKANDIPDTTLEEERYSVALSLSLSGYGHLCLGSHLAHRLMLIDVDWC